MFLVQIPEIKISENLQLIPRYVDNDRFQGLRILIIEDEEQFCALLEHFLQACGCEVEATGEFHSAQVIVNSQGKELEVIISDLNIPGGSGLELVRQAIKVNPGIRALFISGHTDEEVSQEQEDMPGVSFLQKPFTMIQFEKKLRKICNMTIDPIAE